MQIAIEPKCQARTHIDCFADPAEIHQAIQSRAFELFQQRGGKPRQALDDWLQAEEEVLGLHHASCVCLH
jgi:hypothetical protein